jgi:prepilin-type N-terminal cleavage/methylation domain-containing protein
MRIQNSSRGFTLIEIMISIALSGLVLVAVISFYNDYSNRFASIDNAAENQADLESGEQIMLKDLKAIDPSFGTLTLKDDTKRSFFDYYPDVAEGDLEHEPVCGSSCRTYTMQQGDSSKQTSGFAEVSFVVSDASAHILPSMIYDPTWAEMITPAQGLVSGAPPTLRPEGVYGGNGEVVAARGHDAANPGYPGYWNQGQVLMLDTPVGFRPDGTTDYAHVPPRPVYFFGVVGVGKAFVPLPLNAFDTKNFSLAGDQQNLLNIAHPVYAGINVADPHTFFFYLPPIGGGQPMVRLRPVRLVKYTLEPMFPTINPQLPALEQAKRKGAMRLWRQTYYKGAWNAGRNRSMIAEWVKSVQFKRTTVTTKAISFSISKSEAKKGGVP